MIPKPGKLYKMKQDFVVYDESKVIGRSYGVHSTMINAGTTVMVTKFEDVSSFYTVFKITFLVGAKEHTRSLSAEVFRNTFEELP